MATFDEIIKTINRRIGRLIEKSQRDIARRYAQTLAEIRKELAANYEKYEQGGELTLQEMLKHDRLKKMMQQIEHLLKTNYKDINDQMGKVLKDAYTDGYFHTAWAVESYTKTKLNFSAMRPETLTAMLNNPVAGLTLNKRLERQRANIIYQIQQQVTQGLQTNATYSTMAKRLKEELEGDTVKAMRIVRTEGHRVQESAKHDAMKKANDNGVIMMKQWNTMEDGDVRRKPKNAADHRKLNNKKIKQDELFNDGLSEGLAPGLLPAAGSSINCRCFLTYSVEKIEKPQHQELEKMTFEQWEKERIGQKTGVKKPIKKTVTPIDKEKPKPAANKVNKGAASKKPAAAAVKPKFITTKAKERFKQLIGNIKTPMVSANRRKYAKELLDNAGLSHMNIGIKKLKGANGMVQYTFRQELNNTKDGWIAYADTKSFLLSSDENRADRYKYKTLFHEFYHANMHDLELEPDFKGETEWEETATELAAHYMIKEAGIDGMVIPSYANYLTENIPRLKKLDEFKEAETIEDFGAVFMKYRFDEDRKTGKWSWLDQKVKDANKKFDLFSYTEKHYNEYINDHMDECIADVCEALGEGNSKDKRYIDAVDRQIYDGITRKEHTTSYDLAILWAMKKIGVK